MGVTVAVVGASGYAGGEVLRVLLGHPDVELGPLVAASSAGRDVTDVHPHLPDLAGRAFDGTGELWDVDADLVFLALPHGESAALAASLPPTVRVVDLGADHRLADAEDWRRAYGGEHAGAWPYGLPELPGARPAIRAARRVAAPGCYPTAVTLALAPLLAAGLVEPADLVVVAASGTTGAGRAAKPHLLGSEVMGDLSAYKVGTHQHHPEIVQALTRAAESGLRPAGGGPAGGGAAHAHATGGPPVTLSFTPVLAPMPRGILATCTARLRPGVGARELHDALTTAYVGEPFVRVLPAGRWPHTAATLGSNAAHLQVTADERAGRAVAVAAIDNLGKGAAGQAIQCANLMLDLPETAGLAVRGVAP